MPILEPVVRHDGLVVTETWRLDQGQLYDDVQVVNPGARPIRAQILLPNPKTFRTVDGCIANEDIGVATGVFPASFTTPVNTSIPVCRRHFDTKELTDAAAARSAQIRTWSQDRGFYGLTNNSIAVGGGTKVVQVFADGSVSPLEPRFHLVDKSGGRLLEISGHDGIVGRAPGKAAVDVVDKHGTTLMTISVTVVTAPSIASPRLGLIVAVVVVNRKLKAQNRPLWAPPEERAAAKQSRTFFDDPAAWLQDRNKAKVG